MNLINVDDDLYLITPSEDDPDRIISFCGDSFYGDYTFDEFLDLIISLSLRLGELKRKYEGHY